MTLKNNLAAMTTAILFLAGCSQTPESPQQTDLGHQPQSQQTVAPKRPAKITIKKSNTLNSKIKKESVKANRLFSQIFQASLMTSPMVQTRHGIKLDYDQWDQFSEDLRHHVYQQAQSDLKRLQQINPRLLNSPTLLNYRLLKAGVTNQAESFKWRHHNYPVNHVTGLHTDAVDFLLNQHHIDTVLDADAYISRLKGIKTLMLQLTQALRDREQKGIMPPYFVFDQVINDAVSIISGAPFDNGDDSSLLKDFKTKIAKLDISDIEKEQFISDAQAALTTDVKSGYSTLISYLREQQSRASHDDGVWKLPQGDQYYQWLLRQTITKNLNAEQLHRLGLSEVNRIHNQIRSIMANTGFTGNLVQYFEFIRHDPQFNFNQKSQRRASYQTITAKIQKKLKPQLKNLFMPKASSKLAKVLNKRTYSNNISKASHLDPLYNIASVEKYKMAALVVHQSALGHGLQAAISSSKQRLPKFRTTSHSSAYSEGWALYSATLAQEFKIIDEPNSELGQLIFELWHAAQLVIDTGIHSKQWTREQAVDYLAVNTGLSIDKIISAVELAIVLPAQAAAYTVGKVTIMELRQEAKRALGNKFKLKEFHHAILKNGPLPLAILRQQVTQYIKAAQ